MPQSRHLGWCALFILAHFKMSIPFHNNEQALITKVLLAISNSIKLSLLSRFWHLVKQYICLLAFQDLYLNSSQYTVINFQLVSSGSQYQYKISSQYNQYGKYYHNFSIRQLALVDVWHFNLNIYRIHSILQTAHLRRKS